MIPTPKNSQKYENCKIKGKKSKQIIQHDLPH